MLAVTATLALLCSLISCTKVGGGDTRTIKVLIGLNASYLKQQQQYFGTISRQFQQRTGYKVQFQTFSSSSDEQQQLQSAVISGSGPDVFALGTTFIPTAYATGAFHVLSEKDWTELGGRGRYIQQQLAMSGPSRDQQIGVPYATQPYVMAYNTEMFRKAGISGPPKTWTEFVDDAKKLTDPAHGVYGASVDPSDGFDPWKYIWMFTLQSGGELISNDRSKALLGSDPVVNGASFWFDWYTKYKIVDPSSVSWQGASALSAFAAGKSAMQTMVSAGTIPTLDSSAVKGKYAYAPMPTVPYGATKLPPGGKAAASIVSGQDYAIAQYSDKTSIDLQLIKFLTDPAQQLLATKYFGDIPGNAAAAQQAIQQNPRLKAFMAAEPNAVPTTFTGAWGTLQIALGTAVAETLPSLTSGSFDRAALKSRLSQINTQVQSALDEQRKAESKSR
ncbi:MAG TPA: extracellular solute-binding protein [Mycobacteriales bacterium]|jgi:multiple sugar transport system substrate-binding protein|nr:extracellular solute-binding protein [Mycobacteriales bacterium]